MGLTIIVGKKGSGKTAFALNEIAKELKYGSRHIITNMEIFKDKLETHLRSEGFECDVANRLHVLGAKDRRFARWWRIRGDESSKDYGVFGQDERWGNCTGLLYVVDEGQHHYPARGWNARMKQVPGEVPMGEECNDYLCQERKTGDDTIVTTPSSSLLDKDFRTLSTECVVLDNWYRKRMRGIRPSGRFQVNIYENCPPQQGEEPTSAPHFHLDSAGLMACYNTAAGAGFIGRRADMDKKPPPGLHYGWLIVGVFVLCIFSWIAVHFGVVGVAKAWTKHMKKDEEKFGYHAAVVVKTNEVKEIVETKPITAVAASTAKQQSRITVEPNIEEIYALSCSSSGQWGVRWKTGETTSTTNVFPMGRNRYSIDGALCKLVSGGASRITNAPPGFAVAARTQPSKLVETSVESDEPIQLRQVRRGR